MYFTISGIFCPKYMWLLFYFPLFLTFSVICGRGRFPALLGHFFPLEFLFLFFYFIAFVCVFCQCFFFEWVSIAAFMQVQSAFKATFETHAVLDVLNIPNFKGPCTFVWVFILLYLYHALLIPCNSFILTKSSWTASISFLILILISDFPGILNPERLCSIFISAWVAFSDKSSLLAPSNSKLLFFEKSVDHNISGPPTFFHRRVYFPF